MLGCSTMSALGSVRETRSSWAGDLLTWVRPGTKVPSSTTNSMILDSADLWLDATGRLLFLAGLALPQQMA